MLRIHPSKSAAEAKSYYTESFTREDYYSQGQEIVGLWGGKGAAKLGLSGQVDRESFAALCDNLHPHPPNPLEPERLTARTRSNRTVGYDFNFNCPKSVSILYAFSKDGRILDALTDVVNLVMDRVEADIQTRVRQDGVRDGNRSTGNLVRADFTHLTARPVDGSPDPHLHVHSYVFNATFDEVEGQWKAAQFRDLKASAPYYQSIFHNELAKRLMALGYAIEMRDMAFEIVGIPNSAMHKLSRRTQTIKDAQQALGITDPRKLDQLGAATRQAKIKDVPVAELLDHWRARLTSEEWQAIEAVIAQGSPRSPVHPVPHLPSVGSASRLGGQVHPPQSPPPGIPTGPITEMEKVAIQYALLECFARQSVINERTLLAAVLHYGVGQVDEQRIQSFLAQHPDIIRREVAGRMMVTTRGVLAEEQAIVAWAQAGRGAVPALAPDYELPREILLPGHDASSLPRTLIKLSQEQYDAVKHVLTAPDRLMGIRGLSGTGKTTLLHAVVGALQERHHRVLLMTPTARAAREELPKEGFKNTHTVAAVLANPALGEDFCGGVWLVDEAGMLSGRDLYRLVLLAEKYDTRLVLMGDPNQHPPIDRGSAMSLVENEAGIPMVRVEKIQRQKDPKYREVVQLFAQQHVVEGFDRLDAMGKILAPSDGERYQQAAVYYMQALKEKKSIAVISPTHREGRKVTDAIRDELKTAGKIKDERIVPSLRPIDMVEATQRDARAYRPGWAVEVVQNIKGFRAGERLTVLSSSEHPQGGVAVQRRDGTRTTLPVHQCGARLKVFEWHGLQLGRGDEVRVTLNGWSSDRKTYLRAGVLRTIKGFAPDGQILLDNGAKLPGDFAHLAHGYVSTSMAVQGRTVDRVVTVQSAESFGAASMQQAYVCVGRGREECLWLTDDKEELLQAVLANAQRMSALDVMTDAPKLGFIQAVQLREAQQRAEERLIGKDIPPPLSPPTLSPRPLSSPPEAKLREELGRRADMLRTVSQTPEVDRLNLDAAGTLQQQLNRLLQRHQAPATHEPQQQPEREEGFEPEI